MSLRFTEPVLGSVDVERMEGADWAKLRATANGLHWALIVNLGSGASELQRNGRGPHKSLLPGTEEPWLRWNTSQLGGYSLGPSRTMTSLRRRPWQLPMEDLCDMPFNAVYLDNGDSVAVLDGVACPAGLRSDGRGTWSLVGVVLPLCLAPGASLSLLPRLMLSPPKNASGIMMPLEVIPLSRVWKPVLLAVNVNPNDASGGLSVSVIDTRDTFSMIPIVSGRLHDQMKHVHTAVNTRQANAAKYMQMDTLVDIGRHLGEPWDVELHDLPQQQAEYWSSACVLLNPKCRLALQWVALSRPEFVWQSDSSKPESISRGLLPSGSEAIIREVLHFRSAFRSEEHAVRFLDVGSGDGGVVVAVSVLTAELNWEVSGIEIALDVHAVSHQWIHAIRRQCPALSSAMEQLAACLFARDASNQQDPVVVRCLQQADAIFINNLCFNQTIKRGSGGQTLNMQLINSMLKFCALKRTPVVVVTTEQMTASDRNPLKLHGSVLRKVSEFDIPAGGYNWGNAGQPLRAYLHSIVRDTTNDHEM